MTAALEDSLPSLKLKVAKLFLLDIKSKERESIEKTRLKLDENQQTNKPLQSDHNEDRLERRGVLISIFCVSDNFMKILFKLRKNKK